MRIVMAGAMSLTLLGSAEATTAGPRREVIDTIIVHAISGPSCANGELKFSGARGDAARWKAFFDRHPFLGIHYVVDREGVVLASTPEERIANHALDNNDTTIGIELVHDGDGVEPFSPRQIDALVALLESIRSRHAIPVANIKGHSDVDERTFACAPWKRVRAALQGAPRLVTGPAPATRRPLAPSPGAKGPAAGGH
jgi:hypothetical protein